MAHSGLDNTPVMNEEERLTLLDLVAAVDEFAESDAEGVATLRHMFETGQVHFDDVPSDTLPRAA